MTAARLPAKHETSLGEDHRIFQRYPLPQTHIEMARAFQPQIVECDQFVADGWDVLKEPTVTVLDDAIEFEAILTRAKP